MSDPEGERLAALRAAVAAEVGAETPHGPSRHWRAKRAGSMLLILVMGGGLVLIVLVALGVYVAYNGWPSDF